MRSWLCTRSCSLEEASIETLRHGVRLLKIIAWITADTQEVYQGLTGRLSVEGVAYA